VTGVAGLMDLRMNLTGSGAPEELQLVAASASLFPMLGVDAAIGRTLDAGDDRVEADRAIVLSHAFWKRRFGGDPRIVGRTILLDDRSYAVRGVLPPAFTMLPPSSVFPASVDGWVALAQHAVARARDVRYLHAVARLAPGATIERAQREMAALAASYARDFPQAYRPSAWNFTVLPFHDDVVRQTKPVLIALGAIVAIVFAIACVNVANLLLVRGEGRRRELMVRVALGAGPGRLIRLLFAEALMLATAGCALGIGLAAAVPSFVARIDAQAFPGLTGVSVDGRLVAFAFVLFAAVTAGFAVVPVLDAFRAREAAAVDRALGRSARSATLGRTLAAAQIALASVALVSTALLVRTVITLQQVPTGIDPRGVLTFRVTLPPGYATGTDMAAFFIRATERMAQLPGVTAAGAVTQLPMSGASLGSSFRAWSDPNGRALDADLRGATPEYFSAMGMTLVAGRGILPSDTRDSAPVAIVDRAFARTLRPDGNVIGQRIRWIRQPDSAIEIVGIVADVRHRGPSAPARDTVYRPTTQYARSAMTFVVRSSASPLAVVGPAAGILRGIDPKQPMADVETMDAIVGRAVARPRLSAALAAALGFIALIVSVVGVYAVLSYGVSQRVKEFGVRIALGARPVSIVRLVAQEGAAVTIAGLAVGLVLAPTATQALNAALYGVGPTDPVAFAAAAAVLCAAAAVACLLPALRASQADPMRVLRDS
jgi:predicted permease